MARDPAERADSELKSRSAPRPEVEQLAYDIPGHCRVTHTGRSTTYKALNPDPAKRDGLPYLPSFHVGRRRLILVKDSRKWLAKLKAASMAKAGSNEDEYGDITDDEQEDENSRSSLAPSGH